MARMTKVALLVAGLLGLALVAGAPASAQSGEKKAQDIVDFTFQPANQTVPVGTTVTWTNKSASGRPHTVTDRGGTFDTRPIPAGASRSVTFTVPGRYLFFCRINPSKMNGVITVSPGAQPSRVNRIQGLDPAREGAQLSFDPATLTVQAGSAVLFANVGGKPHTLTADDGSFDTGVVTPGAEAGRFAGHNATITVVKPGRYPFHCEVHPAAMKGVLTVEGQETQAPSAASTAARTATVDAKDFAFDKPEVSVAPGGKVTWKNVGAAPHTATFDDVQLDTGNIDPGKSAELTAPAKPGSYSYKCAIHPAKMRGVLVVLGADEADPTKEAATGPPPAASGGGGPGGGISALVLATGVIGAFAGGFGISAFVRRRPTA